MKNIFLVVGMLLWSWSILGNVTDPLEGISKEHADQIDKDASSLASTTGAILDVTMGVLVSISLEMEKEIIPEKDYLDNVALSFGKIVASEMIGGIPIIRAFPDLLETLYGFSEEEQKHDDNVERIGTKNSIIGMIQNAIRTLNKRRMTKDSFIELIAKGYKECENFEEQVVFLNAVRKTRDGFNSYFKKIDKHEPKIEQTYLEAIVRGIHNGKTKYGGFVIVEADWSNCNTSFDEWNEVHKPNFCTPENITIKFQGAYGKIIMNRLNELMLINGVKSIFDLKIPVYSKLRVKIDKCKFCVVGFNIPYHLRTKDLIPSKQTIQDFGFANGVLIPSESMIPITQVTSGFDPCIGCENLGSDIYGASLVHAGLWFVRNKEQFKKFNLN